MRGDTTICNIEMTSLFYLFIILVTPTYIEKNYGGPPTNERADGPFVCT